jgi:protein arginine kinase
MKEDTAQPLPGIDTAISSRIRLARNIAGYPFTTKMTDDQGAQILEKVKDAVFSGTDAQKKGMEYIELHSLKPLDRQFLVERHLVSPEFVERDENRAVILRKDEKISIMINEEDHLRIQCIFPGMQMKEAWELCNNLDTRLEEKLDFAFEKNTGYLTCCPTNTGTGMRASVMLHLPALAMTGYIKGILENCGKIGVAVRGAYGENSESTGNLFQISNQVTLGQNEDEIICGISNITSQISEQERILRLELYKQSPLRFEDRIFRSLGLLKNARIISAEESLKLLSDVRLGVIMDLIKGIEVGKINEMMLMVHPAYLQKLSGGELKPDEREQRRAELMRTHLQDSIQ